MITFDDKYIYKWGRPIAFVYMFDEKQDIPIKYLDVIDKPRQYVFNDDVDGIIIGIEARVRVDWDKDGLKRIETSEPDYLWLMVPSSLSKTQIQEYVDARDELFVFLNARMHKVMALKDFPYIPDEYDRMQP